MNWRCEKRWAMAGLEMNVEKFYTTRPICHTGRYSIDTTPVSSVSALAPPVMAARYWPSVRITPGYLAALHPLLRAVVAVFA